jgi:8-oxo-dGTP diphosphatase
MWEFPGGKLESGESAEVALLRELKEELHLRAEIVSSMEPVPWQGEGPDITLLPFVCHPAQNFAPVPVDHAEIRWIRPEEASQLSWAPADRPLVGKLTTLL